MAEHVSSRHNPILLIFGIIGIMLSLVFFMQHFGIISMALQMTDNASAFMFACFTFISSAIFMFLTLDAMKR